MEIKKKITIIGPKVIDVGYRLFLLEEAERRKIIKLDMKNVRNSENRKERLEILLGDDKENKEKVDEFVKWIMISSNKPDEAEIDECDIKEEAYLGDIITREEYYRTFNASQLTKLATSGVKLLKTQNNMLETQNKMLEIQNKMLETQNKILETQNNMLENQDKTLENQDKMLEKQDKISDSIIETVGLQTDIKSRISRFSNFGQQVVDTQDDIKDKIDEIGKDLKIYIDKRIKHIDQRIDEMMIVKRQ